MLVLPMTDDIAGGVVHSIRSGSIDELSRLLADHAGLATYVLRSETDCFARCFTSLRTGPATSRWARPRGGSWSMPVPIPLGADINATPGYSPDSPIMIAANPGTRRDLLVEWLRDCGARDDRGDEPSATP